MYLPRIDGAYLAVAAGVLLVVLAHGWLIRRQARWPSLVVPVLYVVGVGYLAAVGLMRSPLDYLFAAFGLAGLLLWPLALAGVTKNVGFGLRALCRHSGAGRNPGG